MLGRAPDPGGRAHYPDRLRAAVPPTQLIGDILGSPEYAHRAQPPPVIARCFDFELVIPHSDLILRELEDQGRYEPDVGGGVFSKPSPARPSLMSAPMLASLRSPRRALV